MDNKQAIKILNQQKYPYPEHYKDIEVNEALDLAITALEERPLGKWIPKHLWDNTHIWVCSECGNRNTHGITVEKACWKCGADMRKGDED